jgi:hypothetical protein
MPHSNASLAHGALALATGMLACFAPATLKQVLSAMLGAVGLATPPWLAAASAPMLAAAGLFLATLGVKDCHVAVAWARAPQALLCSEGTLAMLAAGTGFALGDAAFYVFAALPTLFSLWAFAETLQQPMPAAAAAAAAKKRSS